MVNGRCPCVAGIVASWALEMLVQPVGSLQSHQCNGNARSQHPIGLVLGRAVVGMHWVDLICVDPLWIYYRLRPSPADGCSGSGVALVKWWHSLHDHPYRDLFQLASASCERFLEDKTDQNVCMVQNPVRSGSVVS